MATALLILTSGAAAAGPPVTCPVIVANTCYGWNVKTPGHFGGQVPAYASYVGVSAAECCAECVADATLCSGYSYRTGSTGDDKDESYKAGCVLLNAWDPAELGPGNCTSGKLRDRIPIPATRPTKAPPGAKNVLFLVADDMRPSLNAYNPEGTPSPFHSPNLDALAAGGMLFTRAYVQFSYCAPSRNSFMSGRRPDANKVYSFTGDFREFGPSWDSLPGHFVQNGYNVAGSGKLFHPGVPAHYDEPRSWSLHHPYTDLGDNASNSCAEQCCGITDGSHYCAYELEPDTYLSDQRNTMVAMDNIKQLGAEYKDNGKPFFVGLGFHKPHLSWDFPRKFWDKVPANPPIAKHLAFPADVPAIAWHECAECSSVGVPTANGSNSIAYFDTNGVGRPFPAGYAQWISNMRRGYYSAIAYVDDLIGQTLDLLDQLDLADDTVVSFTGDHGWSTGEHGLWCKMTNSEAGTRVPLFFRAPWMKNSIGKKSSALAELVDLYPTLSELAGLSLPTGLAGAHLGGTSLAPMFNDSTKTVKEVALSQFPRCFQNNTGHDGNGLGVGPGTPFGGPGDERNKTVSLMSMSDCHWVRRNAIDFMGYSMRTNEHRFIQWMVWDGAKLLPRWDRVVGVELYDHTKNNQFDNSYLDETENVNMAAQPANAALVTQMEAMLKTEVMKWIV